MSDIHERSKSAILTHRIAATFTVNTQTAGSLWISMSMPALDGVAVKPSSSVTNLKLNDTSRGVPISKHSGGIWQTCSAPRTESGASPSSMNC